MIEYVQGDILKADLEALVNPVNCVGIMGAGLALQFKRVYPRNYRIYKKACEQGRVVLGHMFTTARGMYNPRYIINFPTKHHWRDKSEQAMIEAGLCALRDEIKMRNIQSIAVPALGCGLGGLKWKVVKPIINTHLEWPGNVRVDVYEPNGSLTKPPEPRWFPRKPS